eukprot:s497_g13.t1
MAAVFLKDTLEAAQNDHELQLLHQLKKKAEYVKKLEHIFQTIDDGNGIIKEERLLEVMADPQVMAHLQTLELDVHEGTALFHLLDNGDGEVTLDEFIDGILRCKGPARAVDQVAMRAEIRQMDAKISKVFRLMAGQLRAPSFDLEKSTDVSSHLRAFSRQGWTTGAFFAEHKLRELLDQSLTVTEGALPTTFSPASRRESKSRGPAGPKQVLSLFGESSGIYAAWRGAKVTCALLESEAKEPASALELLAARNQCHKDDIAYITLSEEPRFDELGNQYKSHFDIVTLEPPALAPTYGKLEEGARLYTAWSALAATACKPGGLLLVTCRSRTMSPVRLLRCINLGIWSSGLCGRLVHRSAHAGLDSPIHFALQDTNQFQLIGIRLFERAA